MAIETDSLVGVEVTDVAIALLVVLGALIVGYAAKHILRRVATSTGVDRFAEGTAFERIAESFGTSTVGIVTGTVAWFIYLSGVLVGLEVLDYSVFAESVLVKITNYVPNIVAAFFIVAFGLILSDKAEVFVSERLEDIRVTDVQFFPAIIKYSIIFVAVLMALSQLGVSTTALHILLGSYLVGFILLTGLAVHGMLQSAAAGLYILVTEPYAIGDRIEIGEIEGVVQEIDVFTTRLEDDERAYVVPNDEVFAEGVSREL
jgi:small-conductance mechanosensitive channel